MTMQVRSHLSGGSYCPTKCSPDRYHLLFGAYRWKNEIKRENNKIVFTLHLINQKDKVVI
jgi:hypothetical protein